MSSLRVAIASCLYHRRSNFAVACGVAICTAVLTGALLVGDSMQGSLRRLTLDRLGRIDEALVTSHFFRDVLAKETNPTAVPAILLQVSLENADPQTPRRASRVELIGCNQRFWQLGDGRPQRLPGPREIVLNRPLAERLGLRIGDTVLLRLPSLDAIPADSALGKKRETIRTQRLTVSEIIAAEGLGAFALRPTQRPPQNAYVSLDWLAKRLNQPGRVNAIFLTDTHRGPLAPGYSSSFSPDFFDYGLHVERTASGTWNITSDRMILDPAAERELLKGLRDAQPTLTYLANTLVCNDREVPYSTITAIDFADRPPLGPNEIALNPWAADQLHAQVGDKVQLAYFEPESLDGQVRERSVELRVAAIVELADARSLVPSIKGMTDELTMANWDPPFPFDAKRIRPVDEEYWKRYGPTPKAFVSLATGRRLWSSRFGQTTSLRINNESNNFKSKLLQHLNPAAFGFAFQPIRRQQLDASKGATPFGVLFLCLSFFIIAAAVMLVALLFRLGIDRRASEIGTLLAIGLPRRKVGYMLLGEGLAVAAAGSLLGLFIGIGYAALMLLGLQTCWLPAIATPFLQLHIGTVSLVIGFTSGLVMAMAAIWFSVRRIARIPPRQLLAGATISPRPLGEGPGVRAVSPIQEHKNIKLASSTALTLTLSQRARGPSRSVSLQITLVLLTITPTAVLLSAPLGENLRTGMFFAAGAGALLTLLALVWLRLRAGATGHAVAVGRGNLARMALRNAARNPGRSTLTIGLVAAASFIIVSMSAFHLDPTQQTPTMHSGNGGFSLVAESDQPILQNLNSPDGRTALGFSADDQKPLAGSTIIPLRVSPGDDASCLNLYRPRQPRVLGVPRQFIDRNGFAWAAKPRDCKNPWQLLEQHGDAVPVVLDKNTANYALQLWGGLGETFEIIDGHGTPIRLQVVGLLDNTILQGNLLISESAFLRLFPNANGSQFFLIETPPDRTAEVQKSLEQNLDEYGFSAETTGRRLADFLAIQNTYLATFQSLGGLGLLLGTFGLAVVQLRNVLERRAELALLRATGFRRATLAWLVLFEHATLLVAGLGVGTMAAMLAVLPQLLDRGASVPWAMLAATLIAVLAVGLAAGVLAVRAVAHTPLLAALREEKA